LGPCAGSDRVHRGLVGGSALNAPTPPSERDRALAEIRAAYEGYRREGRERIWDPRNRGFARIVRDRDRLMMELLRRTLPVSGGSVLDLGSGGGRLAAVAQAAGLPIGAWTGVDLDAMSVAEASATYGWAQFVEASADALPFDDGTFDIVVASTLFSSLPSAELERSVAIEVGRVLRISGRLIWYDLRYDNPANPAVHGLGRKKVAELFPGWRAVLQTTTLLPPLARRLGPLTSVAYPLLNSMPLLRSHLAGHLRRRVA